MPSNLSDEARSRIMSSIRSKNTKPEILLRKELFRRGYRYSLRFHVGNVRPDITMVSRKVAIFVDGCFWHKCPKCYRQPTSNTDYWLPKLERNARRDKEQDRFLRERGWKVVRIWEHEIRRNSDKIARLIVQGELGQ